MSSSIKSDFAKMCRGYRVRKGLKQREVAEAINVKVSTYGNVESSQFKVIGRERALLLAQLYQLDDDAHAALLNAWELCPLSADGQRRRASWEKHKRRRNKLRHYDRMHLALVEVLGKILDFAGARPVCACTFGGGTVDDPNRNCEICEALEAAGIAEGWTTAERVIDRLVKLQDELEAKLHPKGKTNGHSLPE